MGRFILGILACALLAWTAVAEEKINAVDVVIEVETDGDIVVTETIEVTAGLACPRRLAASFTSIPPRSISVADVCLSPWNVKPSNPAAFAMARAAR